MRISRIYTPAALASQQQLALDDKASHHLSKVLRLKVGAQLTLFNGNGQQYAAVISAIDKKTVTVETAEAELITNESPLHSHLGIAASRGDRMDWVMQKATELGVSAITPLISERSELKLTAERSEKKHQHWQQIIISACEQCGRNTLPQLNPAQKLLPWLQTVEADKKLVLHHRTAKALDPNQRPASVALLIGPEGGLSASEIQQAESHQFDALRLGPRVLRTETAPLVSLAIVQQLWGDF
jgi:16S rRNA (uracil1498-N3)-methyltransferase